MNRGPWADDPLAKARAEAAIAGECPVNYVDDFASEHWDCWEICSWFKCKECVATPEDMGFGPLDCDHGAKSLIEEEGADWEIPF